MSLKRGLFIQLQVAHALVLRETRTRFGAHRLGYLWALLEPLLWMGTFFAIFALTERSAPTGMDIVGFLVTGLVPYQLFRETSSRVTLAVNSNKGLLFYPQVQPLDLMVSRVVLEGATSLSVFGLIMSAEAIWLGHLRLDNLLMVLSGFFLALSLGGTLGMVLASLALYFPSLEKFTGALLRPLFWLSAIFYTANDVPMQLLEVIRYNPLLHCIEMVRDGWYPEYTAKHLTIWFPALVTLILLFFGLVFERAARTKIQLS